jgi:hypothetical protein
VRTTLKCTGCTIALLSLSGCSSLIGEVTIHNARSGQIVRSYPTVEAAAKVGELPYIDRPDTLSAPVPRAVRGQRLIRMAQADMASAAGGSDLLSFHVYRNSKVYVAFDSRIKGKPAWLTGSFMDTGTQVLVGHVPLELYSNVYPRDSTVVLGGTPSPAEPDHLMYFVVVAPAGFNSEPPMAPPSPEVVCATAAVVGLRWTVAGDGEVAGFRISRDGVPIATTTSLYFSDTSVAAATRYTYTIEAFDRAGSTSSSSSLAVITAAAHVDGDAPYCPSPVIASMTWDWAEAYSQPNGSDLWPSTWGRDGNVYAAFGDGGGFGGDDSRGRSSFGIAMFMSPPPLTDSNVKNVYGGFHALHPSLIAGKAGAIIAVGSDFYALAAIYRSTDSKMDYPAEPFGAPNHTEIAYSLGNAYSWKDSTWSFCGSDASGERNLSGAFCPSGFVEYGRGNAGAPGGYVYLYGTDPATRWNDGPQRPPLHTYLARVPGPQVLRRSAYQYFAGLDDRGRPIWTFDTNRMLPVFTDRNANQPGCGGSCTMASTLQEALYEPALRRYIGVAQGDYVAQASFYEAPTPWGPWNTISYSNIHAATGTGGWAALGINGSGLGVHPVPAWTSPSGLTLWMSYSGGGHAPAGSLFPVQGVSLDSLNLVKVQLNLASPLD